MPTYIYTAKSLSGQTKTGILEAQNEKDLADALRKQGYILISAKIKRKGKKLKFTLPLFGKVPLSQKLMMTRNLQVMVSAGIPLPRAVETLAKQTKNKAFKKALNQIKEDILKGENFSQAIEKHPKIFPELFCSLIKVGEQTGSLDKTLDVLSFHLERSHRIRSKIKSALTYPAVVVGAMILVGAVMLIKVVPQLSEAFASLNLELPKMTKMVMNLGNTLANNWYILLLIIIIVPIVFIFISKKESGKRSLGKIILKIPFASSLVKKINTAYAARTLSSLISGGVSIVEALKITSNSVGNFFFKRSLIEAAEQVKKGKKISEVMSNFSELYPPVFIQMLQVGEETGKTSEILGKLADFLEEEVGRTAQNLSSIIEPVLLLLIGGIIAFFAISMIQPIYSMMGAM
jgi:type IV pilus assembly protein PilC